MRGMKMRKIGLCVFLMCLFTAIASESKILLGGEASWPPFSVSRSIARTAGWLGYEGLCIDSRSTPTEADLYLSFDESVPSVTSGAYTIRSNSLSRVASPRSRHGSGSALASTSGSALVLEGEHGTLFASPGVAGSFSIEFFINPAVTENGSILFQWRSSRSAGRGVYQYARADIMNNRLEWIFSNIWIDSSGKPFDVSVSSLRNIIPSRWTHHQISWDSISGLLEYRMDGSTEALRWVTSNGREDGAVLPAVFGAAAVVEIAGKYTGLIDEFKITRAGATRDSLQERGALSGMYPSAGGRFETQPLDSGGRLSRLERLTVRMSEPNETGSAFFARAGENPYEWTDTYPQWITVIPGNTLSGIQGRYFQIAGELYTDGRARSTPILSSITLEYQKDDPPWPPVKVFAGGADESVHLQWKASIDSDTAGYLVYYGERPGEYLAAGSPIDAGKTLEYTVNGLLNGKLYYFSVSAYDLAGKEHNGPLSMEVSARPRAGHGSSAPRSNY